MSQEVCQICGKTLTFWNRALGTNKCSFCATGLSPEAKRHKESEDINKYLAGYQSLDEIVKTSKFSFYVKASLLLLAVNLISLNIQIAASNIRNNGILYLLQILVFIIGVKLGAYADLLNVKRWRTFWLANICGYIIGFLLAEILEYIPLQLCMTLPIIIGVLISIFATELTDRGRVAYVTAKFKELQTSKSIVEETGISKILTPKKLLTKIILCVAVLAVVMFVGSLIGTHKISFKAVLTWIGSQPEQNTDYDTLFWVMVPPSEFRLLLSHIDYDIFVRVRIPRIILAALVGAALAASGVALQAILRNPLAEPYILGISSGAALGVMTAALAGISWSFLGGSPMAVMAFLFAIGTVWLVWFTGHLAGGSTVTSLLLAGVVINAFFSAVIMLMTSLIDSEQLRSTIMWLMGSIGEKDFPTLLASAIFIIAGIAGLFTISQKLNVLAFGAGEARSLGVNPRKITLVAFALASFITAVAVGLSGLVGFVGLVVPHSVRLVFGPDHRQLLPTSALLGAAFVVICDTIARTIISPAQLPVGVITAIIGGPVFLILLSRYSKKVGTLR